MGGHLLSLVLNPWTVKLGRVQTDRIVSLRWKCDACETGNTTPSRDEALLFSSNQVEVDLQNLGPIVCRSCKTVASQKFVFK